MAVLWLVNRDLFNKTHKNILEKINGKYFNTKEKKTTDENNPVTKKEFEQLCKQFLSLQKDFESLSQQIQNFKRDINRFNNENEIIQQLTQRLSVIEQRLSEDNTFSKINDTKNKNLSSDNKEFEAQTFYTSAITQISPPGFAKDKLSLYPDRNIYCINVNGKNTATFDLSNNPEAIKDFMSSLAYNGQCIEILERSEGLATGIYVLNRGKLSLIDNIWIIKEKIKIKIV